MKLFNGFKREYWAMSASYSYEIWILCCFLSIIVICCMILDFVVIGWMLIGVQIIIGGLQMQRNRQMIGELNDR